MSIFSRIFGGADARPEPLPANAVVIDVRSPGEFAGGHLPGALNIPLETIDGAIAHAVPDIQTPIVLCCRSGMRSGQAHAILKAKGYANVSNGGGVGKLAARSGQPLQRA
jgi:phage shock protein E